MQRLTESGITKGVQVNKTIKCLLGWLFMAIIAKNIQSSNAKGVIKGYKRYVFLKVGKNNCALSMVDIFISYRNKCL